MLKQVTTASLHMISLLVHNKKSFYSTYTHKMLQLEECTKAKEKRDEKGLVVRHITFIT